MTERWHAALPNVQPFGPAGAGVGVMIMPATRNGTVAIPVSTVKTLMADSHTDLESSADSAAALTEPWH
jgi:hypothetical protein